MNSPLKAPKLEVNFSGQIVESVTSGYEYVKCAKRMSDDLVSTNGSAY